MKRKRYNVYLTDEEYMSISKYALSHGRNFSSFVRYFALTEIGRHEKEKSVHKRLEALEQAIKQICI